MDIHLAAQLHHAGKLIEAEAAYRILLNGDRSNAHAAHLLGTLLFQTGRLLDAIEWLQRSIELAPDNPEFMSNLSAALGSANRIVESVEWGKRAVALNPNSAEARNNLGVGLDKMGHVESAVEHFRAAIELRPAYSDAHANLGNALRRLGRIRMAAAALRTAAHLSPSAGVFNVLATALIDLGSQNEAAACLRQSLRLNPADARVHSNLLYVMMHQAETTQEAVLFEARQWAKEHAEGLARGQSPHEHSRDPNRKLRIGYVSADFREHAVARFIEPLLIHHDRERFEVVCYSNTSRPDETTSRFQTLADVWRDIADMDDAVATQVIQNDSIDMLVDLSGHTAGNRLLVFARQPAPIQISYLGFPATTGLSTIQYRLTDWFADPPGAERFYTERLIRVPGHAWSYHPSLAQPAAVDLPALTNGYITFAALHRPLKITSQIARAWARVLDAVPGSRLLVSAQRQTSDTAEPAESLERSGIDPRRLEVIGRTDHANYLRSYFHADIALDAFPYNGTTTTCDALWMGLPVMTLAGTSHVSRTGMSLLTSVEMQELVTSSLDQYVDRAIALANDWACLQHLRARVRHGVSASFISGSAAFCATVESTLNNLWRDHCIN